MTFQIQPQNVYATYAEYLDAKISFIKKVEGFKTSIYVDHMGIPTIGIGLNLRVEANLRSFLENYFYLDKTKGYFEPLVSALKAVLNPDCYFGDGDIVTSSEVYLNDKCTALLRQFVGDDSLSFSFKTEADSDNYFRQYLDGSTRYRYLIHSKGGGSSLLTQQSLRRVFRVASLSL